jgi:peptidoglycan/LPS O-acetylase OafA/YrhL
MLSKRTIFYETGLAAMWGTGILFVSLKDGVGFPGIPARLLEWRPLRNIGIVSFSIYLWHLPLIWMLNHEGLHFPASVEGYWGNVAIVLSLTLILSTATYHLIERQALKFKLRTDSSQPNRGEVTSTESA